MNKFEDATTIEEVIGQAVGAGSMCWDPRPSAQVFDSTSASEFVDDAVARVADLHSAAVDELCTALRLTAEYGSLPAMEGWSWYDALRKHRPDMIP